MARGYAEKGYREGSDRSLKGVLELVRVGVELGVSTAMGLTEVLAVERFFGRCKPDLVARDYDGALVVIDHKCKMQLLPEYMEKELKKYEYDNQFFEYAWIVGQEYGEPVERVYAHMIVLGPAPKTYMHPVATNQEHVRHWLHGASRDWKRMAAIERGDEEASARYAGCKDDYGYCAYYEACHTYYGDEEAFPALYERIGKRNAS